MPVFRMIWTIVTLLAVQLFVCGLAVLPVVFIWRELLAWTMSSEAVRLGILAVAAVPSYILFALCLTVVSPCVTRLLGWRTPRDTEMRISDLSWPLLTWARYMASLHVVRVLAGTLFRGSPVWTAYLRWSGARLGRRVYVASLSLSDYNLLDFGDEVVIGDDVHLAGHTVERGIIKTAGVHLGRNVTIGLGSVIEIGVRIGPDTQIGALSLVPKHSTLQGGAVYVGVPARRLDGH